ncbi:MAG TPA: hypothetical protein VGF24_16280 [Vicinamibacterales bacterium]|jgi:tetratricopeptide (TPR) repeat protein
MTRNRGCFVAIGALVLTVTIVGLKATPADPSDWSDMENRLQRAAANDSAADLRALRAHLLRASTKPVTKERDALIQYAISYLASRMAFIPDVPDKERDDLLADGVQRLQTILKANPNHAEAHILLAGLYGAQIARSPMKGMTLGGRANEELERAATLAPDNPRVYLQQGISAFNTPALFGGSIDKAERLFRRSLDLFEREPVDHPWPNWGRFEAHAWRGQALVEKNDRASARAEYDKALAIAPASGWVRYVLLPALDQGERR